MPGDGVAMLRRGVSLACALGACVAVGGPGAARGAIAAAAPRAPVLGRQFTLATDVNTGSYAGATALGPDGTVWGTQSGLVGIPASARFAIVGRTADGHRINPVAVPDAALPGTGGSSPSIAAARGGATFVWEDLHGSSAHPTTDLLARHCTPGGCGATARVTSWQQPVAGAPAVDFTGYPDQPAVASAGTTTVVAFLDDVSGTMMWAQSAGGGFGPPHPFGVEGQNDPVLAAEPDGRILAAWLAGTRNPWVYWSEWSVRGGFGPVHTLHGARGAHAANLVATPAGDGVALAWTQGDTSAVPGQYADPVWVARRGAAGDFSPPAEIFSGDAGELSLGAGGGVVAVAFSRVPPSAPPTGSDAATGAFVIRSVDERPFGAAVDLDAKAGPSPTVAVTTDGDAFAAWGSNGTTNEAMLAVATPAGPFGRPLRLGTQTEPYGPWVASTGATTVVTWQQHADTQGVFATG